MKSKILSCLLLAFGSAGIYGQTPAGGGSSAGVTAGATAGSAQAGANAGVSGNRAAFGSPAVNGAATTSPGTPVPGDRSRVINNQNQTSVAAPTNGVAGAPQASAGTNGTAAGATNQNPQAGTGSNTNGVPATNIVSTTNQTTIQTRDRAVTQFDRNLIIQVRQRLYQKDPGTSGSWGAVTFASQSGTMLVSGAVATELAKRNLISLVQNTPGVVSVMDQVVVDPQLVQVNPPPPSAATTGTISRYLQPASDPSLGDSHLHSSTSNQFGQRTYIPPARGTVIATNLSPTGSTNSSVLEVTGTNVLVIPTDTNSVAPAP